MVKQVYVIGNKMDNWWHPWHYLTASAHWLRTTGLVTLFLNRSDSFSNKLVNILAYRSAMNVQEVYLLVSLYFVICGIISIIRNFRKNNFFLNLHLQTYLKIRQRDPLRHLFFKYFVGGQVEFNSFFVVILTSFWEPQVKWVRLSIGESLKFLSY